MPALDYARSLSPDCRAVHICTDPERTPQLRERWEQWGHEVPLVILNSPYRSLIGPVMRYLDAVQAERRNHTVTVVVPEFVPTKGWHALLHGQSGFRLKLALLSRRDVVVANVRYYLQHTDAPPPADALAEEEVPHPPHGHEGNPAPDMADRAARSVLQAPALQSAQAIAIAGDLAADAGTVGAADGVSPGSETASGLSALSPADAQATGVLEEQRAYDGPTQSGGGSAGNGNAPSP